MLPTHHSKSGQKAGIKIISKAREYLAKIAPQYGGHFNQSETGEQSIMKFNPKYPMNSMIDDQIRQQKLTFEFLQKHLPQDKLKELAKLIYDQEFVDGLQLYVNALEKVDPGCTTRQIDLQT